jgi:hypothetical protein
MPYSFSSKMLRRTHMPFSSATSRSCSAGVTMPAHLAGTCSGLQDYSAATLLAGMVGVMQHLGRCGFVRVGYGCRQEDGCMHQRALAMIVLLQMWHGLLHKTPTITRGCSACAEERTAAAAAVVLHLCSGTLQQACTLPAITVNTASQQLHAATAVALTVPCNICGRTKRD